MKTKRTTERKLLPARLAEHKLSRAILRHIRRWLSEWPEDSGAHGITEERCLELRFSLVVTNFFFRVLSARGSENQT